MAENVEAAVDDFNAQMAQAINDDTLPEIHFNGFIITIAQGDVLILLKRHGKNITKLNASYTVAKTLAVKLAGLITNLEQRTGNTVMTNDEIEAAFREVREDSYKP